MQKQEMVTIMSNGLKSSLHALEIQVTLLKRLIDGDSAEDTDESDDEDFTEKKATKGKKAASFDEDEEEEDMEAGEDDAPVAKSAKGKKTESFDEDEEEEEAPKAAKGKGAKASKSFDDDEDEEEEAPKAKAKGKTKVTLDSVNDACKARIASEVKKRGIPAPEARKVVLKLLKKNFDVTSVSELEPSQYAEAVKVMAG